jgi:hypothetical protein
MNLDELFKEIEQDLTISFENLHEKTYKIPNYHSKYLKLYFEQKRILNKCNEELGKLYKNKYYYYTEQYEYKLDTTKEINFHIYSDEEYSKANLKTENQKLLVDCLERTLKRVQFLSKDVSNIQEQLKYMQGV